MICRDLPRCLGASRLATAPSVIPFATTLPP